MMKYLLLTIISSSIYFARSQDFIATIQAPAPLYTIKTVQLNTNNCDSIELFTCAPLGIADAIYFDIAEDTNQNIYYCQPNGKLIKRTFNSNSCEYLGSFNAITNINSLVADIDGNIYAAAGNQIFTYTPSTHAFTLLGEIPYFAGDLFFYAGNLFLLAANNPGDRDQCIVEININNLSQSFCYMLLSNLNPLVGAFTQKTDNCPKVYVITQNIALGEGSLLYEIDMVQKLISSPICAYQYDIHGCASIDKSGYFGANSNTCPTLPIRLSNFNANFSYNKIQLSWQTFMESNNDYFLIQRSFDGVNYETIGKQKGSTFSNITQQYLFYDSNYHDDNYYRLQQFDLDGKFTFSKVIRISAQSKNPLQILESPAKDFLQIKINSQNSINSELELLDISGKKIRTYKILNTSQSIDISSLSSGIYIVLLISNKSQHYHQYFIKSKD